VRLAFTEEQDSLRSVVRDFLADTCPEAEVRRLMETEAGFDAGVWTQLSRQLGLCGLAVPEEFGGAGCSFVEVGVVLEELGASLAGLPFLSSVVLAQSLVLGVDDPGARARWLPGLASGSIRGAVAFAEEAGGWDGRGLRTKAVRDGAGWRLDGQKTFVIDGHTADLVLVLADTGGGLSVFAVQPESPGLARAPLATVDQTRKQAAVELTGTPATLVGGEGAGRRALSRMSELAAVALATEAVGGARAVLDASVGYAKVRVQFGRPIGSFQAIKHRCADMLLRVENAKSAAYHALWSVAEDSTDDAIEERSIAASMAKAYCTEAFVWAAAENIQIHGGIGFTWEHSAHLYYKRALSNQLLFGDPAQHRAFLADRIGI
jgi:alkylation response protein AidB-like acyl-CoA dehydrogenase